MTDRRHFKQSSVNVEQSDRDARLLSDIRAGLSIVPVVPQEVVPRRQGAPRRSAVKFLPRCFDV